jgi:hypothetical protein
MTALLLPAFVAGCHSATTPARDGAADRAEVACRSGDEFSASRAPNDPCAMDSDCHNPYLVCRPNTVDFCQNEPATDTGCPSPFPRDAPICPVTAMVTINLCAASYQQPCQLDTDCGPAHFTCMNGQCRENAPDFCGKASDCPQGWDCYVACACPERADTKQCHPPFAVYRCPECMPFPDIVPDAGADGDASDE